MYVYGIVPPAGVAVAVPFVPPKQLTGVTVVAALSIAGCVITAVEVAGQLPAADTERLYVPGANPVMIAVV